MANTGDAVTSDTGGTRWWEGYLVRYFIGFIVGTLCVLTLIFHILPSQKAAELLGPEATAFFPDAKVRETVTVKSFSTDPATGEARVTYEIGGGGVNAFIPLAIFGLGIAYCYLASSPITVLHAGRMMNTWADRQSRGFWFGLVLAVLLVILWMKLRVASTCSGCAWTAIAVSGLGLVSIDPLLRKFADPAVKIVGHEWWPWTKSIFWLDPQKSEDIGGPHPRPTGWGLCIQAVLWLVIILSLTSLYGQAKPLWFMLMLPAIWVGFTQYWSLGALLLRQDQYVAYNRKLTQFRIDPNSRDIRETYTHLREHSNAVFIVVVEIALLAAFVGLINWYEWPAKDRPSHALSVAMGCVIVWLVPGLFMWSRANFLEGELSRNYVRASTGRE